MADPKPTLSDGASILRIVVGLTLFLIASSYIAGFVVGRLESGKSLLTPRAFFALLPATLIAMGAIYLAVDAFRRRDKVGGPVTPREKRSRLLWWTSLGLGAVLGIASIPLGLFETLRDPAANPLNPTLAIALLIAMAIILPLLSWQWHRSIDEHESETYRDGAVVAAYAYMIITPIWWVGARMALLPPVDGVAIYFGFSLVLIAVWLWRRSR